MFNITFWKYLVGYMLWF